MKKYMFYFIAAAFIFDCMLFLLTFITVFGGFCCLFDARGIDLGAMSAFCCMSFIAGYIMAPVVRDCYEEAFEDK